MSFIARFRARVLFVLMVLVVAAAQGCVPRGMSGLWQGTLQLDGRETPLVLAFFQRASGEAYGYVLGGTDALRISAARQDLTGRVTIRLEQSLVSGTREIELRGRIIGVRFTGTASDGRSFAFTRFGDDTITERRFVVATVGADGDPTEIIDVGVLTEPSGRLLAGTYSTRLGCADLGCAGLVTGYLGTSGTESLPTIRATLTHGGTCAGSTVIQLAFDPGSTFHFGDYQTTDCTGTRSGAALGTGSTRTSATHVVAVLRSYAQLADLLEGGRPLPGPVAPIAPDYLHQSREARHLVREINDQIARYRNLQTAFTRFRNAHTIADPYVYRELPTSFGIDFLDVRTGRDGAATVEYFRGDTRRGRDALKYLRAAGDGAVIVGNQIRHDLPYASYAPGDEHLVIHTAGGPVYASVGTWGAHTPGHTGGFDGNAKADWMAFYAASRSALTELEGDGDSVCEVGETCGLSAAQLISRSVVYTAPGNGFRIDSVRFERMSQPGLYFGGDQMWRVRGSLGPYSYDFVHLRAIAPDLRNAMIAAGYTDPWTVGAPSDNLITGPSITLDRGQGIASPQIVAERLPGFPGYFGGYIWGSPWQQIEYFTFSNVSGGDESMYRWLAPELETTLAGLLERDALNPHSFRYGWIPPQSLWLTHSEMALSNAELNDRDDYSSIFSALGAWYENDRRCFSVTFCDEVFSIFPIRKDTRFYDPGSYASPEVSYLVMYGRNEPFELLRAGEVVQPFRPDPISGSIVVAWRTGATPEQAEYQGVSYRLDAASRVLRVAWGPIRATAAEASAWMPAVPAVGARCNGLTVTCHTHDNP